jgi:hypothetical protein
VLKKAQRFLYQTSELIKKNNMFKKACEIARQYTHPVILSMKFYDNTVESGLGSFVK